MQKNRNLVHLNFALLADYLLSDRNNLTKFYEESPIRISGSKGTSY